MKKSIISLTMIYKPLALIIYLVFFNPVLAQKTAPEPEPDIETVSDMEKLPGSPEPHYEQIVRDHSIGETIKHVGIVYGLTLPTYYLTQRESIQESSWEKYKYNFGKINFDQDEPTWNWVFHPITGATYYLYYRAFSYDRLEALALGFVSSTLFEFTIETYTEKASIQDLYITPVIGGLMGMGMEKASFHFLNSDNKWSKALGHVLNPLTLFWFYEGAVPENKVSIRPILRDGGTKLQGLGVHAVF